MGNLLLRTLMTICELGKQAGWEDPTKIPVDEIVEEWRAQSEKGRYESAMWRAAGLEEPNAKAPGGAGGEVDAGEVDNATAGGFFGMCCRAPLLLAQTVIPPAAASPAAPAHSLDIDDSDDRFFEQPQACQ